jgi:TPR repeat protein
MSTAKKIQEGDMVRVKPRPTVADVKRANAITHAALPLEPDQKRVRVKIEAVGGILEYYVFNKPPRNTNDEPLSRDFRVVRHFNSGAIKELENQDVAIDLSTAGMPSDHQSDSTHVKRLPTVEMFTDIDGDTLHLQQEEAEAESAIKISNQTEPLENPKPGTPVSEKTRLRFEPRELKLSAEILEKIQKFKDEANILKHEIKTRHKPTIGGTDSDSPPLDVSRYKYRLPIGEMGDEQWFIAADAARPDALDQYVESRLFHTKSHLSPEDIVIGTRWLQLSASQGNRMAQLALGNCHMHAIGFIFMSFEEAEYWYTLAADSGCADSQFALAELYVSDMVPVDVAASLHYLRLAAEQDHPKAQSKLGTYYFNGTGMPADVVGAARWFQLATTHGIADAQANLGVCYENGIGLPKDVNKALEHYQLAAKNKHAFARNKVGLHYLAGTLLPKDSVLAARMFSLAAKGHCYAADANIARCYLLGIGVPKDEKRGARRLHTASMCGIAEAQILLGKCYLHGTGVGKDVPTAIHLMQKGESNPNKTADLIPDFTRGGPAHGVA